MSPQKIPRLRENSCGLLVIDLQERFSSIIANWPPTIQASIRLIRFFRLIKAPILVTEQYPKGLGHTVAEICDALEATPDATPSPLPDPHHLPLGKGERKRGWAGEALAKTSFSSCAAAECKKAIEVAGRAQWVLCGIETHVCVQQTVFDLLDLGFETFLAVDAISSRHVSDREAALERMARVGATLSTSEALIFEALRDSTHPLFKQASALVR